MTGFVDDGSEMSSRRTSRELSEADADALLSGRVLPQHEDLHQVVGLMKAASAVPAPTPTAALAAILRSGFDPLPAASPQRLSRLARWSGRIAVATAAAMTATLGAATANALPAPLQNAVADVVGAMTPLQLPRSPQNGGTGSEEGDREAVEPADVRDPETGMDASPESADGTSGAPDTAPRAGTSDDSEDSDADDRDDVTETEEPDVDDAEPDSDELESDEPDDATDTAEPDVDSSERDTDEPDTDEPDTDEPDTDEPDAEVPDDDQPETDAADTAMSQEGDDAGDDEEVAEQSHLEVDAERDLDEGDADD